MLRNKRDPEPWVPSILVCEEKHTTRYLGALTQEQAHTNALNLVRARVNSGRVYSTVKGVPPPDPAVVTYEQAMALPDGPIRKSALEVIREYKYRVGEWERVQEEENFRDKFLAENNGKDALQYLTSWRIGAEYEKVTLERLDGISDDDAKEGISPW
jgi:hypothetical protein